MKVVWSPTARRDLQEVRRSIAKDNPAAADKTVQGALRAVGDLERWLPRAADSADPLVVAYEIGSQAIEILAVIHGARRWP